jgi:uncharacterized repeat protein (TIGR01451 family)
MKLLLKSKRMLLSMGVVLMSLALQGQTIPNEVSWGGNGFFVKKVVSNTTIATGVNFSYTIIFTAPAGTPAISIQDLVPPSLAVVSIAPLSQVCGVTPTVVVSGNTVTYSLAGLPPTCTPSGSFTIVVKFPEGVTCNGTTARNRVGIMVSADGSQGYQYTDYVSTTATAVDPWVIGKSIVSGAVVNPNGGSCGYLVPLDGTVTYRLSVMKANGLWGTVAGQHNMSGAVVTDVLPPGAVFVGSTCGAVLVGNTITWNVGSLNAAIPWAYYYCDIQIQYPAASFPNGSNMLNQATLNGTICQQPAIHTSNQTCVEVGQIIANPQASFQKYLALTNRVPGCQGYYQIVFCNNGNVPLTAFNINDVIPSGISVDFVQLYGASASATVTLSANSGANVLGTGLTSSYTSSNPIGFPVNDLSLQMTGSLPVGACLNLLVYFTVNPNPTGTTVTNCATFTPLANTITLPQTCATFTVQQGQPNPCLLKDICAPQSNYSPGDTVRFRVRVQNIGSANMTGATLTDVLHSNFTYLGNESHFIATTYSPACTTGPTIPPFTTAWSGVSSSHSGNNLSWSLPMVPADCQLFYSAYCGYYGTWTLPYYYIEFDVVVSNSALPGVTPNNYSVSGGNLPGTFNSNTVNVLVVASFGQEAVKLVSTDSGATFGTSGTITAGGIARYQLAYKNMSNVPVTTISIADLLGRDDGSNDWLILNRTAPRGSQFDITYSGAHATTLLPPGSPPSPLLDYSNGLNVCLPTPFPSVFGCAPVTWNTTPDRNIRMRYGSFLLPPTNTLLEHFNVTIPANATSQLQVCNDFAAISTASFLLNGIAQSVALTPIAAAPVCLTVEPNVNCCDSVRVTKIDGADCCARITTTCEVKSITVQVANGTIASAAWNCGTLPTGYVGQSSFVFPANNCLLDMSVCVDATAPGVTITYIINFTNGQVCDKVFQMDCQATNCCDSVRLETVQGADCCARITSTCEVKAVQVTVNNGTIGSVNWNCGTLPTGFIGQSTFTFGANNCALDMTLCVNATQPGVSINYVIFFADGTECEKTIKMDCKVTDDCCALVDLKLKSKWPFWKTLVGTFSITNLNPAVPICSVEIFPTPAGTFTTGSLVVDGVTSAQAWNPSMIPTTGNLSPAAVNTINFNLVSSNYSGIIKVCVVKCDGTKCCFDFKWNTKPLIGTDLSMDELSIGDKLMAISISPKVTSQLTDSIKYVSFGLIDESEATADGPQFFAISASGQAGDEYPKGLAVCDNTYMGSYNAFFELSQAKSSSESMGAFQLVFTQKVPKLGCTLFDKDGNVLFTGSIAVSSSSDVSTAIIEPGTGMSSGMFEFLNAYPNPTDGQFNLSFAIGSQRNVEIQMIDGSGQVLHSTLKPSSLPGIHTISMDAGYLPKGNYFVRIVSDGKVLSKPIILQ